jgi:hypothetical protein
LPSDNCVDDEAIILLALKNELRRSLPANFRVETALDAESAMELIELLEVLAQVDAR